MAARASGADGLTEGVARPGRRKNTTSSSSRAATAKTSASPQDVTQGASPSTRMPPRTRRAVTAGGPMRRR